MLSSVYFKPADQFVKKIRDRINERLDLEEDDQPQAPTGAKKEDDDYVDSEGVKREEYLKQSN